MTAPDLARQALGAAALLLLLAAAAPAFAGAVLDRVRATGTLRACIWPEYYGITLRDPRTGRLAGLDVDLSAAFASDLGVRLQHVDSSFPRLVEDLAANRCDVAMFAVGMLPQRMEQLRFTRPYLESDIYAVTTRGNRVVARWEDIDKPGVLVGVQAGTFMEPVMRQSLRQATMVVVRPPATRELELEAGRIDVFMTDYPYSRRLLDHAEWARLIEPPKPFHVLPYAYAVSPGDDAWLAAVDTFVQRIREDGRLEAAARRHGLSAVVARQKGLAGR